MRRIARTRRGVAALLVTAFVVAGAAGLAGSVGAATASDGAAATEPSTLTARASRYGTILFDSRGRVLYLFARDRSGHSSCSSACAKAWPPFLTRGAPKPGRGVNGKLLGSTKRADGTLQVTYAKHPLYYFKDDKKPGQIKCQNVSNFGGLWLVVAPSGRPVR
jgi:predicted lipoprotein with Yx(FWY)xxD motif